MTAPGSSVVDDEGLRIVGWDDGPPTVGRPFGDTAETVPS